MRGSHWGGLTVLLGGAWAGCAGGYVNDPVGFCQDEPQDTRCPKAGAGGAAGTSGVGGSPVMGAGGSAGAGAGGSGAGGLGGGGSGGQGGLVCQTPSIDCDGACIDVAKSDAQNCGECGYACGSGSTCTDGVCSAIAIVSNVVAPYAFALDPQSLYFVTPVRDTGNALPPAVQKVSRTGGTASSLFSTTILRSRSLALVDGTLFFGDLDNNGQLLKGTTTGGLPQLHLANQPAVQQLVAADGRLWWSAFTGNSRLRRVSATGTPTMAEELLPPPTNAQFGRISALAVEGTGATATTYWVNAGGDINTDKGLWRKADTTAPAKIVPDGAMVTLALGESEVFVADAAAGIGKVAANAAAPTTLTTVVAAADVGGAVQGLAVAGGKLYWLAFNAGQLELHRAALDGSEARVLGRVAAKSAAYWGAPIGPAQLTVDGGFAYFSDPGTLTGNTSASNPGLEGARARLTGPSTGYRSEGAGDASEERGADSSVVAGGMDGVRGRRRASAVRRGARLRVPKGRGRCGRVGGRLGRRPLDGRGRLGRGRARRGRLGQPGRARVTVARVSLRGHVRRSQREASAYGWGHIEGAQHVT